MTTSSNPARFSCFRTISRIGVSTIGISGLGSTVVYGARRLPLPPARITAFIAHRASDEVLRGIELEPFLGEPLDRALEALFASSRGAPPEQRMGQRRVRDQRLHLAVWRPHAVRISHHRDLFSESLR